MIPRTIATWQSKSWQQELSELIRDPETLFDLLKLPNSELRAAKQVHKLFPVRTTQSYVSRIKPGDLNDPLLRQILPIGQETLSQTGFTNDPLEEEAQSPVPGLIHKYQGRVLIVAATQCAINCRYCFRRHFDYTAHRNDQSVWKNIVEYVSNDSSINEVIFSGGDPLTMSDKQLTTQIRDLEQISHLTRVRIHSRLPIVAPSRITDELLNVLKNSRLNAVLVVHCNHAQEIDEEVKQALLSVKNNGITLLNQSVLLKGVNDDASTLAQLSESLFDAGALPYYLHTLDKVAGAAHFLIEEHEALSIHNALLATLPGFLVPKLVKELPHSPSKTPVTA